MRLSYVRTIVIFWIGKAKEDIIPDYETQFKSKEAQMEEKLADLKASVEADNAALITEKEKIGALREQVLQEKQCRLNAHF